MFRLIKLAMYGLLGWMLYELYQGITQGTSSSSTSGGSLSSRSLRPALNEATGGMNLTSEGSGTSISTADADGGSMRHTVGRGVVTR